MPPYMNVSAKIPKERQSRSKERREERRRALEMTKLHEEGNSRKVPKDEIARKEERETIEKQTSWDEGTTSTEITANDEVDASRNEKGKGTSNTTSMAGRIEERKNTAEEGEATKDD
jgi:hypothetical protein